jgi:lipopolysaccharide biosynthesis glycosyltransferase
MNKRAVVTITVGEKFKNIAELTHPTIKNYAEKIGADFICLDEDRKFSAHWKKFELYYLLKDYDRIIYVDTDLIIRDDCPDLFEIVPEKKIGMFNEGIYEAREDSLREACNAYK